jgi:hypothetical protein
MTAKKARLDKLTSWEEGGGWNVALMKQGIKRSRLCSGQTEQSAG